MNVRAAGNMMDAPQEKNWAGRVEDDALLRGLGRFGDDVRPSRAVHAVFVRSPHACAAIRGIDSAAAMQVPGVHAVITAADLAACGFGSVSNPVPMPGRGGAMVVGVHRPVLAAERVLHVGEPVALVIGETLHVAHDGAERVAVDYAALPAVVDAAAAIAPGAPLLWPQASGNVAFDWSAPPEADGAKQRDIDGIFAGAPHVARRSLVIQRLVAASLEPRVATASHDRVTDVLTLRAGTQGVASIRNQVAQSMRLKPDELRVVTEDVGGGFGMKASTYPEYPALLYAARRLERPVHWVSTRSEAFL